MRAEVEAHAYLSPWLVTSDTAGRVAVGEKAAVAKATAEEWVHRVFRPDLLPADLDDGLTALNEEISLGGDLLDAVRSAWQQGGYEFRVTQSHNAIAALVCPVVPQGEVVVDQPAREYAPEDLIRLFLNDAEAVVARSEPAQATGQGVLAGRPGAGPIQASWSDCVWWWSDGRALMFSCWKAQPPSGPLMAPARLPDWF